MIVWDDQSVSFIKVYILASNTYLSLVLYYMYNTDILSLQTDLMLEDMSARQRRTKGRHVTEQRNKNPITIGIPQDFRRVSSIVDADLLPETLRRVKLLKHSSDRPLGFYIRDGTSVRVTPYGLEKVPGIFISRLVAGGLAEGTGLLAVNDEILEVNGIDVTGKSLDQVTDMMVANSHNLIITVKPAQQPAATPRAQSMANLSGKPKPPSKGSRKNMDGITQSLKQTSRSQGDIPSAVAGTASTKSSKKNDPDRHSKNSPLRDYTDNSHDKNHIDASRSKGTHDGAETPPLTNDNGIRHNAKHKTNPDQLSLTHSQGGAPTTTHEMS